MTENIRERIIAEAKTWLGTPFHCGSRVKGVGVDCAQLLAAVYHEVGLIPEIPLFYYPCQWFIHHDEERLLNEVAKYAKAIEAPQKGDIAIWKYARCYSHAGIVVDERMFIHSFSHLDCGYCGFGEVIPPNRPVKYFSVVNK